MSRRLAAATLIATGMQPADAIATVRTARNGAIETRTQEDFLHAFTGVRAAEYALPRLTVTSDGLEELGRCTCQGCRNEAIVPSSLMCMYCDEAVMHWHCPRCGQVRFDPEPCGSCKAVQGD